MRLFKKPKSRPILVVAVFSQPKSLLGNTEALAPIVTLEILPIPIYLPDPLVVIDPVV